MSKFYEMIHDKKTVGMPVRELSPINDYVDSEAFLVEKWPLIQAYGLDIVGCGFFTLKHGFVNLREELKQLYTDYDSFAIYRLVYNEIGRLGS